MYINVGMKHSYRQAGVDLGLTRAETVNQELGFKKCWTTIRS